MVWVKKKLVMIKSLGNLILKYTYKVLWDGDWGWTYFCSLLNQPLCYSWVGDDPSKADVLKDWFSGWGVGAQLGGGRASRAGPRGKSLGHYSHPWKGLWDPLLIPFVFPGSQRQQFPPTPTSALPPECNVPPRGQTVAAPVLHGPVVQAKICRSIILVFW